MVEIALIVGLVVGLIVGYIGGFVLGSKFTWKYLKRSGQIVELPGPTVARGDH